MNYEACIKEQLDKGLTRENAEKACGKKTTMTAIDNQRGFYFSNIQNLTETQLSEVEIFRTGKWASDYKGSFEVTEQMLDDMVKNFYDNVYGNELAVNLDHDRGGPAAGWFKGLKRIENVLVATIEWTKLGFQHLRDKTYRFSSSEVAFQWKNEENGTIFKNVLIGCALTNIPFVRGLAPVMFSESINNILNSSDMRIFTKFAKATLAKDSITQEEADTLQSMFSELTTEEQAETQALLKEVQDKVRKPVEETPEEEPAKEPEPEVTSEATPEETPEEPEPTPEEEPEEVEATEKNLIKELSEKNMLIAKMENELKQKELTETIKQVKFTGEGVQTCLSEEHSNELLKLLSDVPMEKAKAIISMFSQLRTVDFKTYGSSDKGVVELNDEQKLEKLTKEKMSEKKVSYRKALDLVLSEHPELANL